MKTVVLRYCALMLCCAYLLSGCVTIRQVGEKSQSGNQVHSVGYPGYQTKAEYLGTKGGRDLLSGIVGLTGAAYGYFLAPLTYNIGGSPITTTKFISTAVYGLAAYGLTALGMHLFTPPEGTRTINRGEEYAWLRQFDEKLRVAGADISNNNQINRLYALYPEQESTFQMRRLEDLQFFETAFPNSSRLIPFVLEGLPSLNDNEIAEVGKKFSFFNHKEEIHEKIRETYFKRQNTIKQCVELMQKTYPQSQDLAEARAAEIAIATNTIESYEEFFKAFPNGKKRTEVLGKAHALMRSQLANCILPSHYQWFLSAWEPPKLGDAKTIEEAKKLYAKALDDQKKYYSNPIGIQLSSAFHTGIIAKKGSRIQITAEGQIVVGFWAGRTDPRGLTGLQQYNIDKRFYHGAVLYKIGNSDWFPTGLITQFRAPNDGMITLMINDADYCNNSDYFSVNIAGESLESNPDQATTPFYPGDAECQQRAAQARARSEQYRRENEARQASEENDTKTKERAAANVDAIVGSAKLGAATQRTHGIRYTVEFSDGTEAYIYLEKSTGNWCLAEDFDVFGLKRCYRSDRRDEALMKLYLENKK